MKKISVIVPVYNVENYIDKCIKSLLHQSIDDFEILLIDDGSTDNSGAICDEYAKKSDKVKVIHKKNRGLSSARNYGLQIAEGEFVSFVDSDDWIHKDMYLKLYKIAKKYDADIALSGYLKIYDETEEINANKDNSVKVFTNIEALNNLYNDKYKETVICCNKIFKKSLFDNIRFPMGKIHEDEFTTHKLIYKAKKIAYTNEELYFYRQRPGSIMRSEFNIKELDLLDAFKEQNKFMKNINDKDLYYKSLNRYLNSLRLIYYKCKENIEDNKDILFSIKKEYGIIYLKNLKNRKIKVSTKINEIIFLINCNIYKKINNI